MFEFDLDYERYFNPILRAWAKFTFKPTLRARLYRKLAARVEHGIRIRDTVQALQIRAAKRGSTETIAIIMADVLITLDKGEGLAQALLPWVNALECMAISAGEKAGSIDKSLRQAADSIGGASEMVKAIIFSMARPTLLFVSTIAALYYIGAWYLPEMTALATADQFTGIALSLYWFSEFALSGWFLAILAALIGLIGLMIKSLPGAGKNRFRVFLDKMPPWSIYRLVVGSSFLVTLSALLKSGIPLQESIIQINKYASPYLSTRLTAILDETRKGRNFGDALDATQYQFPDDEIIDDLVMYSTLPNFDQVLYDYGKTWMKEGIETVKVQAILLELVAFLTMSSVIAWLVVGVMQINQQIGASIQQIN